MLVFLVCSNLIRLFLWMMWLFISDWIFCINIFMLLVCLFIIVKNKVGVLTLFCVVIILMIFFLGSMGNCLNNVISCWDWFVVIINNIVDGCIGVNGICDVIFVKIVFGIFIGNRGRIVIV